jgi:PAS domain S-box-containing protein
MKRTTMTSPLRVLILEDRPEDAELMIIELRRSGFELEWQRVETEADYVTHLDPALDIILADYQLPQFDAMRALHLLQAHDLDIPFILVTGTVGDEKAVACMKQGATDYLLKDRMARLGSAVMHALEEKRLRLGRRQAQAALQESEERFRRLTENALAGVYIIQDNRFHYINPAMAQTFGYRQDEIIDRWGPLDLTHPDDLTMVRDTLRAVLAGELETVQYTFRGLHKNGSTIYCEVLGSRNEDQGYPVIIGTLLNITERRQAEEERLAREKLQVELEKEKELRELKSRFISMVSHEFRNPLATLQVIASTLRMHLNKMDEEQRAKRFAKIQRQIEHMTALLDEVLTIGRMEAGATEFNPVNLDLDDFCRGIVEEFQSRSEATHTLVYSCTGDCSEIPVDEKLTRQIVTNLLSNAFKYSPQGGAVRIDLSCETDEAVLHVVDEGIGIPEKDQERLFETFHRATNVGAISGTGLGLVITKRAVELHGGTITFESIVGVGTTFTVAIPIAQN